MEELLKLFFELKKRIEELERQIALRKITVPTDGYLIVESRASDPTEGAVNGRIYYNTTAGKFKVYENGVWKTVTTA